MATAAKQFIAAIGMIRREAANGRHEWLARWHEGRTCYTFVEAHKLKEETFRQSLLREIGWATGLRNGKDYLVSGAPRAHLQFTEAENCHADPVWFIVEFYLVELFGKRHRAILNEDEKNCWLSAEQIQVGQAPDGRPLCPRLHSLIKQADILAPWQE